MANPTSNFNWQMPTPSDLVTDLPADFEVFGQAVDTSLADLKGGTTDQVLAKNSNTDMDFKWVTSDDANAIQNAIVDAKGDLIAATANDTPARLAVGANNTFLRANSSTATGLEYAGTYTSFTPSWINLTLGNGTTSGKYLQIGKFIHLWANLIFGSTTAITGGGILRLTLPINFVGDTANVHPAGNVILLDTGVAVYPGNVQMITTQAILQAGTANATYLTMSGVTAAVPFTFGSTDEITLALVYEVA